jgi:hypothetical protein
VLLKSVYLLGGRVLSLAVLVFIEHGSRRMHIGGVTAIPTGEWTVQQARNLALGLRERFEDVKFLICGRGSSFTWGGHTLSEACQPVAQGRSLPGLSMAQMRVIWSPAIWNAYTATVMPSCWATRPGWPLTVRSRSLTLPGAARARSAR